MISMAKSNKNKKQRGQNSDSGSSGEEEEEDRMKGNEHLKSHLDRKVMYLGKEFANEVIQTIKEENKKDLFNLEQLKSIQGE